MRTTVELTDEQHHALTALAAKRKVRGFSPLVQEAIDAYLQTHTAELLEAALALEGSISDEQADEVRRRIDDLRAAPWRASA